LKLPRIVLTMSM